MKRLVLNVCFLLAVCLLVLPVGMALASYNYSYEIRVFNNSTTAYPNGLPILVSINNSQLYSYGYIGADGLDTDVQEGATGRTFMGQSARLGIYVPSFLASQSRFFNYRLGDTTGQTTFPVIVGISGNITVSDVDALELGNNFTIEQNGYVDTSSGSDKNLVYKEDAFRTYVSGASNITSAVSDSLEQTLQSNTIPVYSGSNTRVGQRIDSFPISTISKASFYLIKSGAPTGTANITVRSVVGDSLLGVLGTIDVSTLTLGLVWYDFTDPVTISSSQDVRILVEYNDGNVSNRPAVGVKYSDESDGIYTYYNAGYTDDAAKDASIKLYRELEVTVTGVTSGDRTVKTTADATNLTIIVDEGLPSEETDSAALGSFYVPPNGNDWAIGDGDSMYYMDYLKLSVNGTQQLWFEPDTMVTGSILTDRQGGDNNGAINWGSNPADIEVVVGGLTSSVSTVSSTVVNETAPELLSAPPDIEYIPAPTDASLSGMPAYDSVVKFSDSLGAPVRVGYVILMWIGCMVMGVAGLVAVGSGWGFVGGYGFGNALALGTPVWPQFFPIVAAFVVILGIYVWGHVR